MKQNILQTIKIVIIILMAVTLVFSLVISQNEYHLFTCHNDKCTYCSIIQFAKNIINIFFAFIITIMLGFYIFFFLSRLNKSQRIFILNSLVFRKVQLNE